MECGVCMHVRRVFRFPFFAVQQLLQLVDIMRKDATPLEVPVLLKWLRYSGKLARLPVLYRHASVVA